MLPRGMRDLGGRDSAHIQQIRQEFLRVSDLYGFESVDPSPLESLSTLETRSGPAIRDEIYHFEDKGGREVALRFDFTMGLARRAASQRSERLPSKVSSFGGVFRYDEPQKGRYRYFHQWDMEIFGRPTADADAEIIEAAAVLFESLGMPDVSIRVSHRGLVESRIRQVAAADMNTKNITDAGVSEILRAIDKASKKPLDEIVSEYLNSKSAVQDDYNNNSGKKNAKLLEDMLEFACISGSPERVASDADGIESLDGWDHLTSVFDSLDARGVKNAQMDLGIVRGLDYYSGMVFEVFDNYDNDAGLDAATGTAGIGALAGGGRYDALTAAFGRSDLGAAGAAGGVERTILAMRRRGLLKHDDSDANHTKKTIAVIHAAPETRYNAAKIASQLRRSGISAESDIASRDSLKKQLGHASLRRAYAAIIVGPREVASGTVTLRMMQNHNNNDNSQHVISLDDLLSNPHGVLKLS